MYHEDIELSYRAWKRGWRIRYAPDAVAHHRGGHSSRRAFSPRELRSFVRQNEYLTVWKDVTDPALLAEHVLLIVPRLLLAALKRDSSTLIGFGRALRRLPSVRGQRRSARAHMPVSDREVFRRVSSII
jgi:GT2 family glycosyltransferase